MGCPPLEQDVWIAPAGVVGICSVHLAPPCRPPQGPPDTVPNGPAAHFYCRFTLSRGSTPTQLCVTHALEADEEAQREALSAWRPSAAAARPVVAGEIFAGCGGTSMGLSKVLTAGLTLSHKHRQTWDSHSIRVALKGHWRRRSGSACA